MRKFSKFTWLLVMGLISIQCSMAQQNEFGVFLGGTYYMGELNPSRHFGSTSPAIGVYHDAHINTRYTWRTQLNVGRLRASDANYNQSLANFRDLQFETEVFDLSGNIQFNFLPYGHGMLEKNYTPYIFVGLNIYHMNPQVSSIGSDSASTAWPDEDYSKSITSVALPFGLGFKAMLGTLTIGFEWNFRKTFRDDIDGVDNQYGTGNINDDQENVYPQPLGFQKGSFNTDDWYSYAGITLSYRPRKRKNACPQ